ncbi:MAG TPA: oligosaccharide flippase family protein [Solirubrobacteraceae bacterium]|jgi:O-antigen/teichoic acid export membrane protein|nr:oligosaccharide flippase family protein [Solirubrobacteraceae bacterium]
MTRVESDMPLGPEVASEVAAAGDVLDTHEAGGAALRGSVLRTGSYVLGILLSLVSARVLIEHLGVSNFGRYTTVVALVTIVSGFTEGGLNSVVLREFATLPEHGRREMMSAAIGMRLVLTVVGVALAVAFAAVAGYGTTMVAGTALAGAGLVLQLLQSTLSTTLQAQLRFGWVSAIEMSRQVVNVALLVALALAGAHLVPLLAVAIPASAVSLLFTIPLVTRYTSLRPSFHAGRWWRLLRETIPWAVIAAVSIVYFRVALVLMSLTSSAKQTGYFATSFRITEVLVAIPVLVISAAFPILARAEREDSARFNLASGRIFELALFAGTWLVLCLEVGAAFAIHVIAGGRADPSIEVLRIQGPALIASFVAVACGYPLLMRRRYREVLGANLIALAISAVLTLSLAPSMGARGAALAALVAEIGLAISQASMLARHAPGVRLRLSTIAVVALAGGAAVAVGLVLPVHPLIGVAAASIVYFAVLKLLGRFPGEVREVLLGWLGPRAG